MSQMSADKKNLSANELGAKVLSSIHLRTSVSSADKTFF